MVESMTDGEKGEVKIMVAKIVMRLIIMM